MDKQLRIYAPIEASCREKTSNYENLYRKRTGSLYYKIREQP